MATIDRKKEFGTRLRATRKCMGFKTGRALAEAVGVEEKAMSGYERRRSVPDIFILERMCDVLNVTTDWLLLGRTDGLSVAMLRALQKAPAA